MCEFFFYYMQKKTWGVETGNEASAVTTSLFLRDCDCSSQEAVVGVLGGRLEEARCQFPRLCYLPDRDIVRVLSHRGSPLTLVPLISRVFPSVVSVRFTEVVASSSSPVQHVSSSSSDEGRRGQHVSRVRKYLLGC